MILQSQGGNVLQTIKVNYFVFLFDIKRHFLRVLKKTRMEPENMKASE